jgi:hypothetical protein
MNTVHYSSVPYDWGQLKSEMREEERREREREREERENDHSQAMHYPLRVALDGFFYL